MCEECRRHIEWLETRMQEHCDQTAEAVRQNEDFILNATWGPLRSVSFFVGIFAATGASSYLQKSLGMPFVIGAVAWVVTFFTVWLSVASYMDKGMEADKRKLRRLPEWKSSSY